jgi:recombination protein RecT
MTGNKSTALVGREKMDNFMAVMRDRIRAVLPKHLTPERMAQIVLVETGRNPKLAECSIGSLAASVMLASELGLEPSGPLGKFYLIPRNQKNKATGRHEMTCTTMLGYKGLAELARRSGELSRLNAQVVYRDELTSGAFSATIEPPEIAHAFTPKPIDRADDAIVLAYATAQMKDGSRAQVILTRTEIEDRRGRSQSSSFGPWVTDFAAMARKTALRALLTGGLVPLAAETPLQKALEAEDGDNRAPARPESHREAAAREADLGIELGLDGSPSVEVLDDFDPDTGEVTDAVRDEAGSVVPDPEEAAPPKKAARKGRTASKPAPADELDI